MRTGAWKSWAQATVPYSAGATLTEYVDRVNEPDRAAYLVVTTTVAAADADSMVPFRRKDVTAAGDIFSTVSWPHIDVKNCGSIERELSALNLSSIARSINTTKRTER